VLFRRTPHTPWAVRVRPWEAAFPQPDSASRMSSRASGPKPQKPKAFRPAGRLARVVILECA